MAAAQSLVAFDRVTKFNTETSPPALIFGGLTFTLPTNRTVAILGRQETGRTTLLEMLVGQTRPDEGEVVTNTKFSMLLNSATYLHPSLNGVDNSRHLARLYNLDPDRLACLLVTLPGVKPSAWYPPVRELEARDRKSIEILLAALMPYECYVIDDLEKIDVNVFRILMNLAGTRKAGAVFTTYSPKFARQFADMTGVIANRNLYLFDSVDEAERFYGR
jgi:capsular polysaccharide transport system ATP-binding protein